MPVYREFTVGCDVRLSRRFIFRTGYGIDSTRGERFPELRFNLTATNTLSTGVDLTAGYRLYGAADLQYRIVSFSADRDWGERLNLNGEFYHFTYESGGLSTYSWRSIAIGTTYQLLSPIAISGEIERIDRREQHEVRIRTDVSYQFR